MKKIKNNNQSSVKDSINNGANSNQSNWSRCNSFSSSSNDSAIFCSSNINSTNYNKRFISERRSPRPKRSRNSSGSSASSNLSCFSDKDVKNMPILMPAEPISSINSQNISSISSKTLTLKHDTLLNNRLTQSINIDTVLPFRHNLRRNIKKKTCSCDCTATCTTVVVSRQYKGIDQETVEEKTVISRTKVKTFVERNTTQISSVSETRASSAGFTKNKASNHESNRRRRSEIEKLYDSLHEIKWAKNFSPDNILTQLDVRQAASCSVFGKSPTRKSTANSKIMKLESSCSNHKFHSRNSNTAKLNSSSHNIAYKNGYATRARNSLSVSTLPSFGKRVKNVSPPVLEKSELDDCDLVNSDSTDINSYPVLTKEVLTPEKDFTRSINKNIPNHNFSDFNSTQTNFNCKNSEVCPKKFLSFDLKSKTGINVENINDCTFFEIAEEGIRTIDACFREVGAEVVVSTCYEPDYRLPVLTSVEEIHLEETVTFTNDNPPILEPLLETESFSHEKQLDGSESTELPQETVRCSPTTVEPSQKFFPLIDSESLPQEDYSPPEICFKKVESVNCLQEMESEISHRLPCLSTNNDKHLHDQNSDIYQEPPVLKPSLNTEKKDELIKEHLDGKNVIFSEIPLIGTKEYKCDSNKNSKLKHIKIKNIKKHSIKSLSNGARKRILKKYLKLMHFKSRKQYITSDILKSRNFKIQKNLTSFSNNDLLNKSIPTVISSKLSISHQNYPYPSESIECLKSTSLPSRITDSLFENKNSVSQTCSNCQQVSESVTNPNTSTVIQTFNQKLSFIKSEKMSLNEFNNSSYIFHSEFETKTLSSRNKRERKSISNSSNLQTEDMQDLSGYLKILENCKREQEEPEETKVPPRVFTCHFQTINVTHGGNYIQIVLKMTRGKSVFLTHESLIELKEAIIKAGDDNACRLLILNGFGHTFCLGLDLVPIVGPRKNQVVGEIANAVKDLISTLADLRKPLIAIVNGAAYGLGLTLLNHADVTLATNNASFCMPYSKLGYMPEGGASLTLPQSVGATVAMDLILRGQVITAQQAKSIGLVSDVVEIQHLPQELVRRVQIMAENSISAMETTKAMIKMRLHFELPLVLETETRLLPQMWLSPSCQEAIQSALNSGFFANS